MKNMYEKKIIYFMLFSILSANKNNLYNNLLLLNKSLIVDQNTQNNEGNCLQRKHDWFA